MHVAVIGGGAAGMATAHYLARSHRVTVLEKQSLLGGNIRTLNRNVETDRVPAGVYLDCGVIEFHRRHSPGLRALVDGLELELEFFEGGSTSLYRDDGSSFHMPGAIRRHTRGPVDKAWQYLKLAWVMRSLIPIGVRMHRARSDPGSSVAAFLGTDTMSAWIRMLLMYGYSISFPKIDDFPARLAIPTLLQGCIGTEWVRLAGGVYRYIEAIINQAGDNLTVVLDQHQISVTRDISGVNIECPAGRIRADRLVIATPPDQVLSLLSDADPDEQRLFSPWRSNVVETIIHTDDSIYSAWGQRGFNEFDVIEKDGGRNAGYNAYLNRLCDLPGEGDGHYFLAFNLDDRIDPNKIVHRQRHHTPLYTAAVAGLIDEIKARNGTSHTCHAGAYLYNGLHEGAIQSALAVKRLFN